MRCARCSVRRVYVTCTVIVLSRGVHTMTDCSEQEENREKTGRKCCMGRKSEVDGAGGTGGGLCLLVAGMPDNITGRGGARAHVSVRNVWASWHCSWAGLCWFPPLTCSTVLKLMHARGVYSGCDMNGLEMVRAIKAGGRVRVAWAASR